jgi:hypothetical protein
LIKTWNGLNVLASPSIRRLIATRRELPTLRSIGLTVFCTSAMERLLHLPGLI